MLKIVNLENNILKQYSLEITNEYRISQILGEIALKSGNPIKISDTAWYERSDIRFNKCISKTVFSVEGKDYTSTSELVGNEARVELNFDAYPTGLDKYVGRDEYEHRVYEYNQSYILCRPSKLYKIIGDVYYNYKNDELNLYKALIKLHEILNIPDKKLKQIINDMKENVIAKLSLNDKEDEAIESINQIKTISSDIKLLGQYKKELLESIYLLEHDDEYIKDLNKLYNYTVNNESSIVKVSKFIKWYSVREYDFKDIPKQLIKK